MQIEFEQYKLMIELFNKFVDLNKINEVFNKLQEADIEIRQCSKCNNIMVEGYVIGAGESHYCSDLCLESEMSREDYEELYNGGNGDSYYTQWD